MSHPFDTGYVQQPFRALAEDYPEADVYPPGQFRVEWGPIFHRGRLDGSARVVVIGQDPAQHETVVRRILVGEAGRRLQGLLAKLGVTQSYVLINTYLYSVYGSVKAATRRDPRLIGYRNRWLDALLVGTGVEAVISLGTAAAEAWQFWKSTPSGLASNVAHAAVTHPTEPESSSKGDRAKLAAATAKMLQNWNAGLQTPLSGHRPSGRGPAPGALRFGVGRWRPAAHPGDGLPGRPTGLDSRERWLGAARGKGRPCKAPQHHDHGSQRDRLMKSARTWFPLTGAVNSRVPLRAGKKVPPIDPLTGPKQALAGFVVTMDDAFTIRPDGIVYIDQGCFVAVQDRAQPAPPGFAGVQVVETGGILFPGLIELHNHLCYNALPLWSPVPKRFQHRDQWSIYKDYRPMISGPMTVIGESRNSLGQAALLPALVRYVECKCLLGGVTTSQGIMLASNAGVQRFYRGLIRNVEQTDDPTLAEAQGRIADVVAKDAEEVSDAAAEGE